jgi:molybdopterin synthase catalytic subunit
VDAWITEERLVADDVLARVGGAGDGAVLLFLGTVRDQNEGRRVSGMRYAAYRAMAERVLSEIVAEAAARVGSTRIAAAHRIGELTVGDVSVAIAISTPHRAHAYDGSRYIIEEIKKRLPVWKQEHYVSGQAEWLGGAIPAVDGAGGP